MNTKFLAVLIALGFGHPVAAEPALDRLTALATEHKFRGEIVASHGALPISVTVGLRNGEQLWRWASVTKQVIATIVMQEVAAGRIDLDKPLTAYLPGFRSANARKITVRFLLRHQTGLPNPEDTALSPDTMPSFYTAGYTGSRDPLNGYCAGPVKGEAGGDWAYNNCDYMVAGALLEAVTGKSWQRLVQERIAKPLKLKTLGAFPTAMATVVGTTGGKAEDAYRLETFGASAGLYGSPYDLMAFDRALMTGKLLPAAQLAEMWDGQPKLGSIALGQWVFSAPLKGCSAPVRIVERRGLIGGVDVRNFILPDNDVVVIAFSGKGPFDFGEVWQGKGFSFDLLSAAACP